VLWDCQKIGGYSVVAANHRRYVEGFAKWGDNVVTGLDQLTDFTAITTTASLATLLILLQFGPRHLLGSAEGRCESWSLRLPVCCILAWAIGLYVMTPIYYPYPRLWQPWAMSVALLIAAVEHVGSTWHLNRLSQGKPAAHRLILAVSLLIVIWSARGFGHSFLIPPTSWESRSGALKAAEQIRKQIADPNTPVLIHSEPAVWFHLREQGQPAVIADGLTFLHQPLTQTAYLVVGPQAERDPAFERDRQTFERRLEPVGEFSFQPSRIVLLDQFSPRELAEHPERRTMTVTLYRIRP
jgi:hypothetical protein